MLSWISSQTSLDCRTPQHPVYLRVLCVKNTGSNATILLVRIGLSNFKAYATAGQELAEVARCVELQRATVTAVCCRCIEFLIVNLQSSPQVKNATPGRSAPTILNVTIIHGR